MRALKLVQHVKANADRTTEGLIRKIRRSNRCADLLLNVPAEEHKRDALGMCLDLTDWLATETDSIVDESYVALGVRRAQQGIPFNQVLWAVCIARDYLWEYIQQECLLDEPVEFWGGVNLLRSVNQFFDRALYFTLAGYQKAGKDSFAATPASFG
jgi:hypothetical protein